MTPRTFRKKPVEIQAMHFGSEQDGSVIAEWCGGSNEASPDVIEIPTLEGTMRASLGDWIIRGVQGEFYPCKPDIFEATYVDPATSPQTPGVVVGYKQQQTRAAIDAVNRTKTLENELGDWIAELRENPDVPVDGRWASIAVTHLQQGFMALNRAVFQPESRLR